MDSNDDDDDDFQSTSRRKTKPKQKRNKLSSKNRLKSQKVRDGNKKEDCILFSPVSCSVPRKTGVTNNTTVIVLSDDDDNHNMKMGVETRSNTKGNKVSVGRDENNINANMKPSHLSSSTPLQNISTEEISVSEVSAKNLIERKNIEQNNEKTKIKLTVAKIEFNQITTDVENPDILVKEQMKSNEMNYSREHMQKSNCLLDSVVDKPTSSEKHSKTYSHESTLKEYRDEHEKSLASKNTSHLKCLSLFTKPMEEAVLLDSDEKVVKCNMIDEVSNNKEVENSEKLLQSNHPVFSSNSTEEANLISVNVNNSVEANKGFKSKFFTEKVESNTLTVDTKIRSASLEHLNDSRYENDSVNISEEKCISNKDIQYGVVSEKNSSDIPVTSDDDSKRVYSCPLCWKTFEIKQSQLLHMKGCAARHNLTTKQLLDAMELQDRQTAERKAMGLPNIPTANAAKKPASARRNTGGGTDNNLQLALALSASIQDAEEREQLQEDVCLMEAGLVDEVVERQKSMLERYGFTSSRPVLPNSSLRPKQGSKNKNKRTATLLTSRTKEDRERIITEKVAIVLIGDENQASTSSVSEDLNSADTCSIGRTKNLHKYERQCRSLWNASSFTEEPESHYVESLANVITPCRVKAGDKLKNLSQVPGRNETPIKPTVQTPVKGFCPSDDSTRNENQRKIHSPPKKPKARRSLVDPMPEDKFTRKRLPESKNLAETLISDWRSMLNKKAMSDVKIIVEYDQEIPAHKLVFYARCQSILKDVIIETGSDSSSSSMIVWVDISYRAALAFLQYIYCGLTSKLLRLEEKDMSNVRKLAQRYRVPELLEHLKVVSKVRTKVIRNSSPNSSQSIEDTNTGLSENPVSHTSLHMDTAKNENFVTDSPLQYAESVTESYKSLQNNFTPGTHKQNKQFRPSSPKLENKHVPYTSESENLMQVDHTLPKLKSSDTQSVKLTPKIQNQGGISKDTANELMKSHEISQTENQNNVNSTDSRQCNTRSESPDLFMDEDNDTISQTPESSQFNINYLLKMINICFTQNEASSQKASPIKSVHGSPSVRLKPDKQESSPEKGSPIKSGSQSSVQATPHKVSPVKFNSGYSPLSIRITRSPSCKHKSISSDDNDTSVLKLSSSQKYKLQSQNVTNTDEENERISSDTSSRNCINVHNSDENSESNLENVNHSQTTFNSNDNSKFDRITFLENLLSDSPTKDNNKDVPDRIKSMDSKRKYSERDSSTEGVRSTTKKICRDSLEIDVLNATADIAEENANNLWNSKPCEDNIIDTLDLTQNSNESEHIEQCSSTVAEVTRNPYSIHESSVESEQNETKSLKNNTDEFETEKKANNLDSLSEFPSSNIENEEFIPTEVENNFDADVKHFQDDWDSFDEMCNASDPEIFTQSLNKLISSKNASSNSQSNNGESLHSSLSPVKSNNKGQVSASKFSGSSGRTKEGSPDVKAMLEDSFFAQINESVLWRDENAPELKISSKDRKSVLQQEHNRYRTPIQKQKNVNNDVTPPANYSVMRTPDLKKELDKYGIKLSLTKKQAKTMLRFIYDQLHPYITVSDSEDSSDDTENNLPSPFKVPGVNTRVPRSPGKKSNANEKTYLREKNGSKGRNKQTSVAARRNLASQIDANSDCDELSLSSSSSTVDIAEEMMFDDLEEIDKEYMPLSQDASSSTLLPSVVQRYISENPELLQKVLEHEPIWIEEILDELKAQNFKFKMTQLMDYFDEQCITFRTVQGQRNRMRKRQRQEAKKKKSPIKKKGKRNGKSATTSGLNSPSSTSN